MQPPTECDCSGTGGARDCVAARWKWSPGKWVAGQTAPRGESEPGRLCAYGPPRGKGIGRCGSRKSDNRRDTGSSRAGARDGASSPGRGSAATTSSCTRTGASTLLRMVGARESLDGGHLVGASSALLAEPELAASWRQISGLGRKTKGLSVADGCSPSLGDGRTPRCTGAAASRALPTALVEQRRLQQQPTAATTTNSSSNNKQQQQTAAARTSSSHRQQQQQQAAATNSTSDNKPQQRTGGLIRSVAKDTELIDGACIMLAFQQVHARSTRSTLMPRSRRSRTPPP